MNARRRGAGKKEHASGMAPLLEQMRRRTTANQLLGLRFGPSRIPLRRVKARRSLSYDCWMIRASLVLAAAVCVGASLAGCSTTPKSTASTSSVPAASGPPATPGSSHAPGGSSNLVVKVTSVTAIKQPKNPLSAKKTTPAERVTFTVSPVVQPLSCNAVLLHSGAVVGSAETRVGTPTNSSASVTASVAVEGVQGGTFAGTPADAQVECHAI